MTFKTLSNLRSSKFIGWGRHSAAVKMLLVNNQWLYCESCHFCNLSVLHYRRTWATHIPGTLHEAISSRKLLRAVSFTEFLWTTSMSELWQGGGVGVGAGGTWDCSSVGAWVRLDERVQAAGPDTGTQTCYCPWAFKHRLVWSGRRQRAQTKANIINIKEENDYLWQKMSRRPL